MVNGLIKDGVSTLTTGGRIHWDGEASDYLGQASRILHNSQGELHIQGDREWGDELHLGCGNQRGISQPMVTFMKEMIFNQDVGTKM